MSRTPSLTVVKAPSEANMPSSPVRSLRSLYRLEDGTTRVRACIFGLDGLIINTTDLTAKCHELVLAGLQVPGLTMDLKAEIQGIPHDEAVSHILSSNRYRELAEFAPGFNHQNYINHLHIKISDLYSKPTFLPGAHQVIHSLNKKNVGHSVALALVTSSLEVAVRVKMQHLTPTLDVFPRSCRLYGGDPPLQGRGKPHPYVYELALQRINESLPAGEPKIAADECLVFDPEIAGMKAALAAGMRVVWVPHPDLAWYYGINKTQRERHTDSVPAYLQRQVSRPTTPAHVQRQISISTTGCRSTNGSTRRLTNDSNQEAGPMTAELKLDLLMKAWKMEGLEEKFHQNVLQLDTLEAFPFEKYGLEEKIEAVNSYRF